MTQKPINLSLIKINKSKESRQLKICLDSPVTIHKRRYRYWYIHSLQRHVLPKMT